MPELQRLGLSIHHSQTLPRIIRRSVGVTRGGVCRRFSYLIDGTPPDRSPLGERLDLRVVGLPSRVTPGASTYELQVSVNGGPVSCHLLVVFEGEGDDAGSAAPG